MARYGKEHKQATRQRIIEVAGDRLKRDGVHGSGIATLMADAGLTNGAFYAHFESKEDLVASALAEQLRDQLESRCAPGVERSKLGTHEDAQRLRPDGRDAPGLPSPGQSTTRRRGPRAWHPERPGFNARRASGMRRR